MKKIFLIFLIYLFLAVIYTYPLIFKLNKSIYGYAGDNLGAIRYLWWWKYTFLNHLDLKNSFLEQAPFGFQIDSETGSAFYYWPLKALTLVFNERVAYNLVLLLSFPAASLSMYLLTKSLVTNSRVAFWAGFVFGFSPYHFWKAYNHLDLSLLWTFPLAILFWWRYLTFKVGRKDVVLAGLFTVATILTNFYYGFFLLISITLLTLFSWFVQKISFRKIISSYLLFSSVVFLLSMPFLAPTVYDAYVTKGAGQSAARVANYQRPLLDVVSLSARPWDYLLPSQDNPLLGRFIPDIYSWIRTLGGDFKVISGPVHERTIFLGFTSIILLLLNSYLLILPPKRDPAVAVVNSDFRCQYGRVSIIFWLMVVMLFLISMPPYIFIKGRYTFYLPSYFLHLLIPVFRTYSRLGIFVLLFVVLNASLVLDFIFKKINGQKLTSSPLAKLGFLLLISFSALEFANVPPSKVIDLKMPQALEYLSQKNEGFNFVVYPKEFNVAELLVFQPEFKKGFLNFHSQSEYSGLWPLFDDFHNPKSYSILASLGIRYAVFQKKLAFPEPNPVDDLWYTRALNSEVGTLPPGLSLEKDFGDSAVYAVTAKPSGLVVFTKSKVESFPSTSFQANKGELRIYLANLTGGSQIFDLRILDQIGGEVIFNRVSSENLKTEIINNLIRAQFDKDRGFIDISLMDPGVIIGSIQVNKAL